VLKPVEVATKEAAQGLRRSADAGLLSSELSLYWRVICEALTDDAASLGGGAASGGGQAAAIAAAAASQRLEALEAALPPSMEQYCELLGQHAEAGAAFATRQLLRLGCRLDLSDVSAARSAGALATALLRAPPGEGSFGAGGTGKQEEQLVAFAQAALGPAAPPVVFAACDSLCGGSEGVPSPDTPAEAGWVQALGLLSAMLQAAGAQGRAGGAAALRDVQNRLVLPALQSGGVALRREAVRALGLLMLLEPQPDAHLLSLLRGAAAHDKRPVRTHAVRALCDLALLHGLEVLGRGQQPVAAAGGPDAADSPLPATLLAWVLEPAAGLSAGSGGLLEEEEEEEVPSVAAEGLAKLLLGAATGEEQLPALALAQLLALHQAADEHRHPRLSQCLTVFLPTFAAAGESQARRLADATLPALRLAVGKKWLPKLAAFLSQLLRSGGEAAALDALACALLEEAHHAQAQFGKGAKPFVTALVRTAASLQLRAPETLALVGAEAVDAQAALLKRLCILARHLRGEVDKPLAKDLEAWEKRMRALPGALNEPPSDALAAEVLRNVDEARAGWVEATALPLAAPARASRARKAAAKVVESSEEEEEEDDESEDNAAESEDE